MTDEKEKTDGETDLDTYLKRLEEMLVDFETLRGEIIRLQSAEGFSSLFGTDGVIERIDEIIEDGPDLTQEVLNKSDVTKKAELLSRIVEEFKSAIEGRPTLHEMNDFTDLAFSKIIEYDENITSTIQKTHKLLRQINGFFSLESRDKIWMEDIIKVKNEISGEKKGFRELMEGENQFLKSIELDIIDNVRFLKFNEQLSWLPKPKTFLASLMYLTTLNLTGFVQATISFLAAKNSLKFEDLFDQEPDPDIPLNVGSHIMKQNNIIAGLPFKVDQDDEPELNDLLSRAMYTAENYSTFLKSIRIGRGTYNPELSDVNSHMITNNNAPSLTYQNLGMWPSMCERYGDLSIVDKKNWLGTEYQSESIPGVAKMHKIYYRDFLDFIQDSGFVHKKVTGYRKHQRIEPSLNSFLWNGEMRKFRANASIFFFNPHCAIAQSPIRIAVDSISSFGAHMSISVGIDFFENQIESDLCKDEKNMKLRQLAEKYCFELLGKFDQYQAKNGLLKNSKFDAYIDELTLKGRTFDDMLISDTKKKLLDDNIFAILRNSEILQERGVETNRGVMLAGPPGVGKSLTIDAIVSSGDCTVLYANFTMLHKAMDFIFETARKYAPTILILEDIDALGITGQRGESSGGMGLSNLLNNMDGISNNNGVISVATTNHPESMDWALIARPGRFDVRIDYPYPDHELLKGIMELKLSKYPCEKNLDLDSMISRMPLGFTGSHIQDIVNQANYISINEATDKSVKANITYDSLQSAFERSLYNFNKFLAERPHIKLANPESASQVIQNSKSRDDELGNLFG